MDTSLSLLAEMASATDTRLRALAQRLAARVVLELAEPVGAGRGGVGKIRTLPLSDSGADLDVEASMDALIVASASGRPPNTEDIRVRSWARPDAALVLLIDRSGSMSGERVASAAVAAAAAAMRASADFGVVAFNDQAIVVKGIGEPRPIDAVVNDVLRLRGFGPTDLSLALRVAAAQLSRSPARERRVVLLSDCRPTEGGAPERLAAALDHLGILAPADDCEDAAGLAAASGARWASLAGPSSVPAAFRQLWS